MKLNRGKTILVTGGAGFIGSNFIRSVLSKHPEWFIVNLDALTYAGSPLNLSDLEKMHSEQYTFIHYGSTKGIKQLDT